jgi:hypothetical protein
MTEDIPKFTEFKKILRLSRLCVVTEKIDGTNASIYIGEDGTFLCGSRTRWITPRDDNYGFAMWAYTHKDELMQLGPGHHFGEWWGQKIQRAYGLTKKRFSLFNTSRWNKENLPSCCHVVPILFQGIFDTIAIHSAISMLELHGSQAAPGFMRPEGVVIYHVAGNLYFKKTIEKDQEHKSQYETKS